MIPVVLAIGDQIVEAYSRIGLVMAFFCKLRQLFLFVSPILWRLVLLGV